MPKTLLFDLDGTLIENSMDTFLPPYFSALTKKLAHLVTPETLIKQLTASTRAMVANTDLTLTMEQVFAADFFPKLGISRETMMPLLEDFYAREYPELRSVVKPIPEARKVIARAIECGFQVVIATMPVFPGTALRQRLEWGGLADFPYRLITDYETMHSSKPHAAYYREIASMIGIPTEDCVMIGNEIQNDILPAKRAGMKTFLVRNDTVDKDASADWIGTLADLYTMLEKGF